MLLSEAIFKVTNLVSPPQSLPLTNNDRVLETKMKSKIKDGRRGGNYRPVHDLHWDERMNIGMVQGFLFNYYRN